MSKVRPVGGAKKYIENKLHSQLGTTDEILKRWEKDSYPTDGDVVSKFWKEIELAPTIKIVGDYDVDGICASHILSDSIHSVFPSKRVSVRIPRRFSEGYGINNAIADEIIETMPAGSLIITVDNGIAAAPVLERLKGLGYRVVVTDHHELRAGCEIPKVDMIIDPSVHELPNPFSGDYWCGAGVAFKLCEPIVSKAKAKELEVYAGLATVSDCMQLREGNWGLVRRAIKAFRNGKAPQALVQLLTGMGQDPSFCNEDHFGFYLGPAFNAPGRLLDRGAVEVLKYLHNPTEEACQAIIDLNNERKQIRDDEYELVRSYIAENKLEEACPIWVAIPGLHEGIVGILAGKVSEEYHRPAIVLTNIEESEDRYKGSARGYGDFNIFEYLCGCGDVFERMGGHKGAAGLSMTLENFEKASHNQLTLEETRRLLAVSEPEITCIEKWEIPGLHYTLNKFRPFGEGNPIPKFELQVDLVTEKSKMVGNPQVHLFIEDANKKFKITHFFHEPNELSNKIKFGMQGVICGSGFRGRETPNFNVEEVFDIDDEREKTR